MTTLLHATPTRVLIVDDDPTSVKLASILLRAEGAQVLTAGNEAEAIAALTWQPHVVLMDVSLSSMGSATTGIDLTRRITVSHPGTPVVLFSAQPRTVEEIKAAGAVGGIWKPITTETFAKTVQAFRPAPKPGEKEAAAAQIQAGERALSTAGQRRINVMWERTQAVIAISVSTNVLSVCAYLVWHGDQATAVPAFLLLSNVFFLVVGTYFQRTNRGPGTTPHTGPDGR